LNKLLCICICFCLSTCSFECQYLVTFCWSLKLDSNLLSLVF
jgi:hypothetical protein